MSSDITKEEGQVDIICKINPLGTYFDEGILETSPSENTRFLDNNSKEFSFDVVQHSNGRFDISMLKSIKPIEKNLDVPEMRLGAQGVKDFVFKKVMNVLVPVVIALAMLLIIFSFYQLMFSSDEAQVKKAGTYLVYGVIGIIIIMSAKYISTILFENILHSGNLNALNPAQVAE
ncbi:MAG: hypothetical protein GXP45_02480 [bacterium]|nr:hypothetical protein [bacterium]